MELIFVLLVLGSLHLVAPDAQVDALYDLRASLKASPDQLTDWDPSHVIPCAWTQVGCDVNDNVVSVSLSFMGFTGSLSPRIGVLSKLTMLSLVGNQITGGIPEEFGNLTSLDMLHLKSNRLTRQIPPSLGNLKNLQSFSLGGNQITGGIPEEFGNLTSLTMLDLESNRLTGQIPPSLGNIKNLQLLTLSQNNLEGPIPDSLSSLPNLTSILLGSNNLSGQIPDRLFQVFRFDFTGNKLNCGFKNTHPCTSPSRVVDTCKKSMVGIIVRVIEGGVLGLLVLGCLILVLWRGGHHCYKREVFVDVAGEVDHRIAFGQLHRFGWRELQLATDNFNERNVIGEGGLWTVYKGVLADNTEVVVKRLTDCKSPGGDEAFVREAQMITAAFHLNILRLIGVCTTPTERLLVYPYMHNSSVAYRLRELKPGEAVLDWETRKKVALGTALGLRYLHESCDPKIIHGDVNATNVLLDEDFEAKLVDARKTSVPTKVRGMMGHIAPEYLSTGKSSEMTDVFGFGIMLLELVTGQRAIDYSRVEEEDNVSLLDHVKQLEREKRLDEVVDRNLNNEYNLQQVEMMIKVALLCTQWSPEERPAMAKVVRMLEGVAEPREEVTPIIW